MKKWFDEYGNFIGSISDTCVWDCTRPGSCDKAVTFWRKNLDFHVPEDLAIYYLKEFGAWIIEELKCMEEEELAELVLWIACGDIKENREFLGLIH